MRAYSRILWSPKSVFLACFLSGHLVLSGPAFAAAYYVDRAHPNADDANPGTSESAPWATVNHAANTLVAGDLVYVKTGTYTTCDDSIWGNNSITPTNSGTPSNRIIFRVFPGDEGTVTIDCWVGGSANYVTWDGFALGLDRAYYFNGSSSGKVRGVVVENCRATGLGKLFGPGNYYGIRFTDADGPIARNCRVSGFKYTDIHQHNAVCIQSYRMSNAIIEQNEMWDCDSGIYDKNGGEDNEFRYNYIHDVYTSGFRVDGFGCDEPPTTYDCGRQNIHHNVIDTPSMLSEGAITLGTGSSVDFDGVQIWNNTIYNARGGIRTGSVTGIRLYNNIIWVSGSGDTMSFANAYTDIALSDYSNFYPVQQFSANGSTYSSSALWQSATDFDRNSMISDPLFVDAAGGDFHLQAASPARGTGRVGGVSSGAAVNMGAYETGTEVIGVTSSASDTVPPSSPTGLSAS